MKMRIYRKPMGAAVAVALALMQWVHAQSIASVRFTQANKNQLTVPAAQSLKQKLQELEERFNVRFTYKNALLEDKTVQGTTAPSTELAPTLKELLTPHGLRFKKIDDIYVIYPVADKPNFKQIKHISNQADQDRGLLVSSQLESLALPKAERLQSFMNPKAVTVSGRVTNENGEGLPGVSVAVKGTTIGTTTNGEGRYTLGSVPEDGTLVFSFIGYVTEEVAVANRTAIDVKLLPDLQSLSEVVVLGYGSVQKKDLIGAVGTATAKDFGDVNVSNAQQLIQGKVAGVQVINSSGLPGANVNVVVRGVGSFTNASALYVIDGIQGGINEFNAIAPYDIESVTVLKDASSVAIYGARAANGVVLVTTKRAKSGAPKVTYNGYYGIANTWRRLDLMNAPQYIDLVRDISNNNLTTRLQQPDALVDRTDWQDEMFRTARLTEHNVTVSGGTDKSTYMISNTYTNQDAIVKNFNFQRYTLRVNLEQNVGKRFKLGQQAIFRYTVNQGNTVDLIGGLRMPPYAPVYDPTNLGGFSRVTSNVDLNDASNPLTDVFNSEQRARDMFFFAQLFGEVEILNWLKFRSQLAVSYTNYNNYNYTKARANGNLTLGNGVNETYGFAISPILENFFTINKTFGVHNFNAVLGNTYINGFVNREIQVTGGNFSNDELRNVAFAGQSSITGGGGGLPQGGGISYFARLNYTLMGKYLLTASFRRDGSPVFPAENRFANFPAVGVAWKISEESFMKDIPFISELKLRASYGITGNSNIPLQRAVIFRGSPTNIVYSFGENRTFSGGATVNQPIDPTTRWETTVQTDVGLDVGLLNNRLELSFDYYNRNNRDLLVGVPISLSSGFGGPFDQVGTVIRNAATAFNRGFEVTASFRGEIGAFRYSVSGNAAYNRNEVVSLGAGRPFNSAAVTGGYLATRTEAGQPIGSFYGYQVDRVASTQAEITRLNEVARQRTGNATAVYQTQLLPGDIIFRDLNGDGQVTEQDQTFLGSPLPLWNYGGNINLGYKGIDLMIGLYGIAGVKLWNDLTYWTEGTTRPFNSSAALVNRWRREGDVSEFPRAGQNANGNLNLRASDRFIEDGSYLRVRNVTLGYTLPQSLLNLTKNTLSSVRVYVTAQNLFTFTRYSGFDPEISAQNQDPRSFIFARGIDVGQFPQPRTFLLGVQVGF